MRKFTPVRTGSRSLRSTWRSLRTFGAATSFLVLVTLIVPFTASASTGLQGVSTDLKAFVPPTLLEAATAAEDQTFNVIVQGAAGRRSADVAGAVAAQGVLKSPRRLYSVA